MTELIPIGRDTSGHRPYFVLAAESAARLPRRILLPGGRFDCLLAWDATHEPVDVIADLAQRILEAGAESVCAWGPDCERVHDVIDEVIVGDGSGAGAWSKDVLTTWHADEALSAVIDFLLFWSPAATRKPDRARSVLGVVIGSTTWRDEVVDAFSDPEAFAERMAGDE